MFSSFSVFFLMLYIIIVVVFNSELELHNSPVSLCVCASSYITSTPTHTFMVFDPPQFHRSLRVVGGTCTRVSPAERLWLHLKSSTGFWAFALIVKELGWAQGLGGGCTVAVETQLVTFFCRLYILLYYFKSFFSIKKKLQDLWRCVTPFVNAELPGKSARVGGVCSSIMTAWSHAALCWQIRSATLQKWHPHTGS